MTTKKNRPSLLTVLSWLWLLAGLSLGGYLIFSPLSGPTHAPANQNRAHEEVSSPERVSRPIKDVRPGHRVFTENPEQDSESLEHFIEPEPTNWRQIDLLVKKGDGGRLHISLLRPLEWIEQNDAAPGALIKLETFDVELAEPALVLDVLSCPPIQQGPGRVVTGTFRHTAADIIDLTVEGLDDPIGTTSTHPFWSEDRQDYIPAGSLRIGERLRTREGATARLTSITERGPPATVYNLEVQGDHTYFVSSLGLLVHNNCANPQQGGTLGSWMAARSKAARRVVDYDPLILPGPNPNNLRMRIVDPEVGPSDGVGVYLKPHNGRTKIGSAGGRNNSHTFRDRYSLSDPEGGGAIEVEIPQTRFGPPEGVDDSIYPGGGWTAERQRRFDEEYLDRITPPEIRYRAPNKPQSPVSQRKWDLYRHIFGYGDLPSNFGL